MQSAEGEVAFCKLLYNEREDARFGPNHLNMLDTNYTMFKEALYLAF